jgi:sulfate transport system substrate-binding protein
MKMFTVEELFGNWKQAQKTHFDEGGIFDQIARSRR